ncbi:tRNA pseudouridine(38-40) synthase TruA [Alkalicella caledoniensis]|uniref:tRNA pseudouridine synthase A n=1 Tax=Alkalicella caledoniensis TaxID=2731377 RepID=A0A7G9W7U5_ALKCA|nr:tRNA pseudouridine(38-40) synthase TruA [Alkalicella caledoniensis]QNO14757.1 tRNA pseudouridine(38-40) synthase TruA [Alkalicella caledoniensis]
MFNTKLVLAYQGTNYCGFQIQTKSQDPTVQYHLDKVLSSLFNEEIKTILCSRTDSGVHANGQVVNFIHSSNKFTEQRRLVLALNAHLPYDIRVLESESMYLDFHARYHAKGKLYSYLIDNAIANRPLTNSFSYHVHKKLDFEKMVIASKYLIGTHDFSSFKGSQGATKTTVRTITRFDLTLDDQYIKIQVEGNGFLYNMVRIIVGTLIHVGMGKISPEAIKDIIEAKDRMKAGPTAPAKGLILEKIYY